MNRQLLHRIAFATAALLWSVAASAQTVLHHVHGLAFSPDGQALVVPAHTGLAVWHDGHWSKAPGMPHDLMGFSVTKGAMYSSGHPSPGTPLKNPLGLVKSTDGGRSWQPLALSGEADFHVMAAGYTSGAIYVFNPQANSRMPGTGLYVTTDEGTTWNRAASSGLSGQLIGLAAHPTDPGIVAAGTSTGLYISRNSGSTFQRIGPAAAVTAVAFAFGGKHLYVVTDAAENLLRIAFDGTAAGRVSLPPLERDFVLYVAQNPRDAKEMAFATRLRNVYLSGDGGKTWQQIARAGKDVAVAAAENAALRERSRR